LKNKPSNPTSKEKESDFEGTYYEVTILSAYKLPEVISTFRIATMFVVVDLQTAYLPIILKNAKDSFGLIPRKK
jgi:hypothetical protein